MEDVTFFITRHINTVVSNQFWKEAYLSIRKIYNNKIIIIDDNSNKNNIVRHNLKLTNTIIINSEYPGAGELLPYYYFYKLKPSKKMIYIHDSMILLRKYNEKKIKNICDVSYHFYIKDHKWNNGINILNKLKLLKNKEKLIDVFREKKWWGCFGVSSIITYNFINKIQNEYNLFNLINYVKTREDRMDIERIFGICCYSLIEKNNFYINCIHNMPNSFCIKFIKRNKFKKLWIKMSPIFKYWSGR